MSSMSHTEVRRPLVSYIAYPGQTKCAYLFSRSSFSSIAGENGFNQAIELAADSLQNVKFVQEKKLIQKYFDEIALDTGKFVFGIDDTLKALEMGAVETLIVWENLDVTRYVLRNAANGLWSLMWRWIVELSAELRLT